MSSDDNSGTKKALGKAKGWQHFVAGNVGGLSGLTVSYPLDTIKVRLQTKPGAYKGVTDCFMQMVKQEGVMSLYRGLISPVVGYGIINSIAFGTYGRAGMFLRANPLDTWLGGTASTAVAAHEFDTLATSQEGQKRTKKDWASTRALTVPESVLAGCLAGFTSSFVRAPIERVKTLCQAVKHADGSRVYRGSLHCAVSVAREQGIVRGLMRGVVSTIAREVPQYAVYYALYERIKLALTPDGTHVDEVSPVRLALAGGLAGTIQWLPPIYSIDVIKSRIQASKPGEYAGIWDCAVKSYKQEGARVFVRGLSPALLRAFPLHGTIFVMYELTMRTLRGM